MEENYYQRRQKKNTTFEIKKRQKYIYKIKTFNYDIRVKLKKTNVFFKITEYNKILIIDNYYDKYFLTIC